MEAKTYILKPAFIAVIICVLALTMMSSAAIAQNVKIISGSPGDTISFSGTGNPNSQVRLEVSATISVGTTQSGGRYNYQSSMNGLNIPGGNSLKITVSPVDTLTVYGSFTGIPVGMSMDGSVSNHVGVFSKSVPAGTYNILVKGIANGSPSSVSMTVHASQTQNVGSAGTYTASISTSGLPSTIYTVTQDNTVVALVYLGVAAPATPTPTSVPSPSPNATTLVSQGTGVLNNSTSAAGNATVPAVSATTGTNGTATGTSTATPSPTSSDNGLGSWGTAILAISCGTIIGIVGGYLYIIRKR